MSSNSKKKLLFNFQQMRTEAAEIFLKMDPTGRHDIFKFFIKIASSPEEIRNHRRDGICRNINSAGKMLEVNARRKRD